MSDPRRFEHALETLLADRSPRWEVDGLSEDEQRMVRMAQLLRGSGGQEAAPSFVDQLHARLFAPRLVSRRTAFLTGMGTLAAGIIGGLGLDRLVQSPSPVSQEALITGHGRWYAIANLAELPDGAVRPFTAGAVQGFLIHRNGRLRAVSRICTHMGCALRFNAAERTFECPCHGAEFDLEGQSHHSPTYPRALPPLPAVRTRVRGETVEALGA